jgi:hypothetical protein
MAPLNHGFKKSIFRPWRSPASRFAAMNGGDPVFPENACKDVVTALLFLPTRPLRIRVASLRPFRLKDEQNDRSPRGCAASMILRAAVISSLSSESRVLAWAVMWPALLVTGRHFGFGTQLYHLASESPNASQFPSSD